ncbi:MAG: C25 family cysteine peptidase [bacterium]
MRKTLGLFVILLALGFAAETVTFDANWASNPLFNVINQTPSGVELVFSSHQVVIEDQLLDGVVQKSFGVPSVFIAEPGVPNLNAVSRYVAMPEGAQARVHIIDSRTEVYHNIEVAPAPNIPRDDDDSPLVYEKDMAIYGQDAFWPALPVRLSERKQIRGVDIVIVGVMPFQYNPVTKELIVYKDIRFRIEFIGGNGHFGEDRLRSRLWEPILQGHLLNYASLPKIDFYAPERIGNRDNVEYIIIVPDDAVFEAWGDTIAAWRKLQGISSEVFTLTEVGGSTAAAIESFLNNAYNTWSPAPVAFLLLSDYPSSGDVYGITSPVWSSYCVSDHIYADVDGDDVADMYHGRFTAQSETHLSTMINKFLSYERSPYTDVGFYDHPLVACGWQTERWFQLCSETVRHFMINHFGKNPYRQYNIYSGTPTVGGPWSSRVGTAPTVQYWYNAGWLPSTTNPYDATWWNNGSASGITNNINAGSFIVQHRDHGATWGWGEPSYTLTDLDNLTNTMYPFVFSINCLTGQYDYSSEVFAEKFHRITYGALGVNAASQSSYSFVNDTYVWGLYDGLFPEFDASYAVVDMPGYRNLRPCEAMTYGLLYHDVMWFPDSSGAGSYRAYTRNLFHHHTDCFVTLYSEIPMTLSISHPPNIPAGQTFFMVTANDSSVIALTVAGEIIGVAEGTGSPVSVAIPAQTPGTWVKVTITKANYYRYEQDVEVISSTTPYVTLSADIIDDVAGGNGDGLVNPGETIDYGVYGKNVGGADAFSVYGLLTEGDTYVTLSIDSAWYGDIPQNDSSLSSPYYHFTVATDCPNGHDLDLTLYFHDINDSVFTSFPSVTVYAPELDYQSHSVNGGNGNGILDPGETADLVVTIENVGGATAYDITSTLITSSAYITINDASGNYGTINQGNTGNNSGDPYNVTADIGTPSGTIVDFGIIVNSGFYTDTLNFQLTVGIAPGTVIWGPEQLPSFPPYPTAFIYGVAYDPVGDQIFVCDGYSQNLRVYSSDSNVVYYGAITPPDTISDVAYSYYDDNLWVTGYKNMKRSWKIDKAGTSLRWFTSPANDYGCGIAFNYQDGNEIWFADRRTTLGQPAYIYVSDTLGSATQYNCPIQGYMNARCLGYDSLGHSYIHVNTFFNSGGTTLDSAGIYEYQGVPPTWTGKYFHTPSAWNIRGIGFDPRDGNYWITIVQGAPSGDNSIVKVKGFYTPVVTVEEMPGVLQITSSKLTLYPSIFTNGINIKLQVLKGRQAALRVYDAAGRVVRHFDVPCHVSSHQTLAWQGCDDQGRRVPAGVYFIRFETDDYQKVEKAILLR